MNEKDQVKSDILQKLSEVSALIPESNQPDLPIDSNTSMPKWQEFEHQIWQGGEEIRQLIDLDTNLREDTDIQNEILVIATNRNARRGRQPFVFVTWI